MLTVNNTASSFTISLDGVEILRHSAAAPCLSLGVGEAEIKMYRGNFDIKDELKESLCLSDWRISQGEGATVISFTHPQLSAPYVLTVTERDGYLRLRGQAEDGRFNRLALRLPAEAREHVMGGGEQFSALDMRGRVYPIWTREQGVGRNKATEITQLADALDGSGGDYHTTFFPQPTFVSSRRYFVHLENYDYAELDLTAPDCHKILVWNSSVSFVFAAGADYAALLYKLTGLLGRQKPLPDWAVRGIWLGVQGGTERALEMAEKCEAGGIDVSAVWIQDWEGKRVTSFGKRLMWDWRWNRELYPRLDEVIKDSKARGLRWMGYINPYLAQGGALFEQARELGYFVKNRAGEDYLFDFGEFDCGVVDLSMHAAFEWYKQVIKQNLIELGFSGWMADFGEYLPADCVCHSGKDPMALHNEWPVLWAKCNREAVEESGKAGEIVFFMRSGGALCQRWSTLLWAGDQNVDWSEDDGLPSVITAALSAGMSGFGLHTCDAGGYTTLFHIKRSRELLLRWLELACFSPVMRTHEGNRPDENVQLYSDAEIIASAARLSRLHSALAPYIKSCMEQNARTGLPVMRPLFFLTPEAEEAYRRENYEYLLGDELLVAPVVSEGARERELWLPTAGFIHLWSGKEYPAGSVTVPAELGKPPVFYRRDCQHQALFRKLAME